MSAKKEVHMKRAMAIAGIAVLALALVGGCVLVVTLGISSHSRSSILARAERHYDRGVDLAGAGMKGEAAAEFDKAGWAHIDLSHWDGARASFDRALTLDPDLAGAYEGRATANVNLGQYEQALSDSNEAIDLDPDSAGAYYDKGLANAMLGASQQAVADLKMALSLTSDRQEWAQYALEDLEELKSITTDPTIITGLAEIIEQLRSE